MRVAILGEPAGWHVGRLLASLRDRGHEASVIRWQALTAEVEPGDGRRMAERFLPEAIERADIVVVRGMPAGGLEDVIFRMDILGRLAADVRKSIGGNDFSPALDCTDSINANAADGTPPAGRRTGSRNAARDTPGKGRPR